MSKRPARAGQLIKTSLRRGGEGRQAEAFAKGGNSDEQLYVSTPMLYS